MLFDIPKSIKNIIAALSGAVSAFVIVGLLFSHSCCSHSKRHFADVINSSVTIPFSSNVENADITINGVSGKIYIDGTTDEIFEGKSNIISVTNKIIDTTGKVKINVEVLANRFFKKSDAILILNPDINYSVLFNAAATSIEADLKNYRIKDFSLSSAVSYANIVIGNLIDTVHIDISSALTDLTISLPEEYACKITSEKSLSTIHYDKSNIKLNESNFLSENYGKTHKIVFIEINAGLSEINILRY